MKALSHIIDLTMTLDESHRGVAFETKYTVEQDGWNARTLHLYSHAGTHLDAPFHFGCSDVTVDQIPLGSCMGKAHLVNATDIPAKGLIETACLGDLEDQFQVGDSLLIHTNWSREVSRQDHYRDNFPRISEGLALWCAEKGVKILGVESPSVADVNNLEEVTRIHHILLEAGILIVEGLTNLDQLQESQVFFAAIPLKIGAGDGTPCRAFAIPGNQSLLGSL